MRHIRPLKTDAGGPALLLREIDGTIEVLAGKVVLLTSDALGTERAFGRLAQRITVRPLQRVLIGGLGFGATASGVLKVAPEGAEITVVEKLASLAELVRGEFAHLAGRPLDDP